MKNLFADNKCKILSKHFGVGLCRNANYIVNIIEKLERQLKDREKETKWMLTLQTVYPYGLNDRVGGESMAKKESRVVCNKFLQRHGHLHEEKLTYTIQQNNKLQQYIHELKQYDLRYLTIKKL